MNFCRVHPYDYSQHMIFFIFSNKTVLQNMEIIPYFFTRVVFIAHYMCISFSTKKNQISDIYAFKKETILESIYLHFGFTFSQKHFESQESINQMRVESESLEVLLFLCFCNFIMNMLEYLKSSTTQNGTGTGEGLSEPAAPSHDYGPHHHVRHVSTH